MRPGSDVLPTPTACAPTTAAPPAEGAIETEGMHAALVDVPGTSTESHLCSPVCRSVGESVAMYRSGVA